MLAQLYCSRYHTGNWSLFTARHLTSPAAPTPAASLKLTPSSWGETQPPPKPSGDRGGVSLLRDTWIGPGFFSQVAHPA